MWNPLPHLRGLSATEPKLFGVVPGYARRTGVPLDRLKPTDPPNHSNGNAVLVALVVEVVGRTETFRASSRYYARRSNCLNMARERGCGGGGTLMGRCRIFPQQPASLRIGTRFC